MAVETVNGDRYSIAGFVKKTLKDEKTSQIFQIDSGKKFLQVNVKGTVRIHYRSLIAYRGKLKFQSEGLMEGGLFKGIKKIASGKVSPLIKVTGEGIVHLAHENKNIKILHLSNETLCINCNNILAFEDTIGSDLESAQKLAYILLGGLTYLRLQGTGLVAISTFGEPVSLRSSPDNPVITAPNSTVAWSGSMVPQVTSSFELMSLIEKGIGREYRYIFKNEGFVAVQPLEEIYLVPE